MSAKIHPLRRRLVRTLGAIVGLSIGGATAIPATTAAETNPDDSPEATQYVAVVDRIVDGEFVVLLLEDDGELVDQHVEPVSAMDDIEETDILQVVLKDDEVLAYQQLPKRPGEPAAPSSRTIESVDRNPCHLTAR